MKERKLTVENYLSEVKDEILSEEGNIYLIAKPGLGKTKFVDNIAKDSRVLLVSPMCSTRDGSTSSFENFKTVTTKDLSVFEDDGNSSYAVIWDTFVIMCSKKLIGRFDYIVLDEIHNIILHSAFRDKVYDLADIITRTTARQIFMTGTPCGEIDILPVNTTVSVSKKSDPRKLVFNVITVSDDVEYIETEEGVKSKVVKNSKKKANRALLNTLNVLMKHGIPTIYYSNSNRTTQDRIISALPSSVKVGFYSSSSADSDLINNINAGKGFSDYDLICATTYLSEGVNIYTEYSNGAVVVSDERLMNPQNLIQIANRFRESDITIYYVHKESSVSHLNEKDDLSALSGVSVKGIDTEIVDEVTKQFKYVLVQDNEQNIVIDDFIKKFNDVYDRLRHYTTIDDFKAYLRMYGYEVNVTEYDAGEYQIDKQIDNIEFSKIKSFVANKLDDILDILSSVSIENRIYKKDVVKECRNGINRIEGNVIYVTNLYTFNEMMKYVKTALNTDVPRSTVVRILKAKDSYPQIKDYYHTINYVNRAKKYIMEQIDRNSFSKEAAIASSLVYAYEEIDKIESRSSVKLINTRNRIRERVTAEVSSLFKIADKYDLLADAIYKLCTSIQDPNASINHSDIFIDFIEEYEKNVRDSKKNRCITNASNRKKTSIYKSLNGTGFQFESVKELMSYLNVTKSEFYKGDYIDDSITDTIPVSYNEITGACTISEIY